MRPMKPRVYIETSVVSFLCGRLNTKDKLSRQLQEHTRQWWPLAKRRYQLVISDFVVDEASRGAPAAAQERLAALEGLPFIEFDAQAASELASELIRAGALPAKARYDALHLACCACAGIELLATWNFRHLANASKLLQAYAVCENMGYKPPNIVTLYQLTEN
ncbi:MAG: type II toxin-antitoxin system VapC family toxin [Burkholderiaceae bacterium]